MKKILFILAMSLLLSPAFSGVLNLKRYYSDTVFTGGKFYVIAGPQVFNSNDSIAVLFDYSGSSHFYIWKGIYDDWTGQRKVAYDGWDSLTFTIPASLPSGPYRVFITGIGLNPLHIFVRSSVPDVTFSTLPYQGYNGDSIKYKLKYTYLFSNTDTFKIWIGGRFQVAKSFKDIKKDSLVSFVLNMLPSSTQLVTYNYGSQTYFTELSLSINTTAVLDAVKMIPDIEIKYYTITGIEEKKPTEGLYIWSASNGQSGKVYISNMW